MVAKNPAGWGYQLYFATEEANEEIGKNVRHPLHAHNETQMSIIRFWHRSRCSTRSCTTLQVPQNVLAFRITSKRSSPAKTNTTWIGRDPYSTTGSAFHCIRTVQLEFNCVSWQEMNYLISQTAGSVQGPLNYYRAGKLRFEEEQAGRPANSLTTGPEFTPLLS